MNKSPTRILVTGGAGYVGTVLCEKLLSLGYEVIVVDTFWFGDNLFSHKNLIKIKKDIRNLKLSDFDGVSVIVHLASIANDPSVELDPSLSWEIGTLGTKNIIDCAVKNNVKKVIIASSGSVYGVRPESQVTELCDLTPISIYNKVKMVKERVALSYSGQIDVTILRPATICGYSSRMRLDLTVNVLTFNALKYGLIKVFGGEQIRPNLHIDDMIRAYVFFIEKTYTGIYNVGFENYSIKEIANIVKSNVPCEIEYLDSDDVRSYRLNSDKLMNLGFSPIKSVQNAIVDISKQFKNGLLDDTLETSNVKWMKTLTKENNR
jgi:nucleoside-diphosphate-sugar epimerase